MRHIVIKSTPPAEWQEEAKRLTELLQNARSNDEREQILGHYAPHWRNNAFRDWLIEQFHRKCWYSEAKESVSAYHVDHFRPKGRVKDINGNFREGYWWLAFRWENYRISGQLLNVKKQDVFPLVAGDPAKAFDEDSLQLEAPVLLDPCVEDDASLVSFNEGGEATCADGIDDVDKLRVEKTIEIIGLNSCAHGRLVENRADKWIECQLEILTYKNASGPQAVKCVRRASAVARLKNLVKYESEFSSVALACIKKTAPEPLYKQVIS